MLPDRCASSISLQHQRNPFGHRELFALAVACSLLRHIERQTEVFRPLGAILGWQSTIGRNIGIVSLSLVH